MDFDYRLTQLNNSTKTPSEEVDAAVRVYERLVTAQAICSTVGGAADSSEVLAAVFSSLCSEMHAVQGETSRA